MDWQPEFYIDETGKEPVEDFILRQPDGAIAEILHVLKLLRRFNITLGMPYVRKIGRSGIRELRIKHSSDIYRIFFIAWKNRRFILLHAIVKKTDDAAGQDINLAIKRMGNYTARNT